MELMENKRGEQELRGHWGSCSIMVWTVGRQCSSQCACFPSLEGQVTV